MDDVASIPFEYRKELSWMLETGIIGWYKDLNLQYLLYTLHFAFSDGKKPKNLMMFSPNHEKLRDYPFHGPGAEYGTDDD